MARGLPLGADREIRPATTAQPRVHDELPHAVTAQALGAFERCVASAFERADTANIFQEPRFTRLGPRLATRDAGPGRSAITADGRRLPAIARAADGPSAHLRRVG